MVKEQMQLVDRALLPKEGLNIVQNIAALQAMGVYAFVKNYLTLHENFLRCNCEHNLHFYT